MSSVVEPSGITSQIWQRLLKQSDTNADNRLSKDELDALKTSYQGDVDIDQLIRSFDVDGDQSLSSSELPSSPLDVEMLGPLLDWQEYGKADAATRAEDDKRVIDALFQRADVDRDGFLSRDEMEAEKTLRRTRWLEGKATDDDPVYMIRLGADQDRLSPEDFLTGRRIPLDALKVIPPEEIPADVRAAIQKVTEEWQNSPDYQKPLTAEEHRQQAITDVLNTPLTATYMARLLSQLSAAAARMDPFQSKDNGTLA